MRNQSYATVNVFALSYSSSGVNPIIAKLPTILQERWTTEANIYKPANNLSCQPFLWVFLWVFLSNIYTLRLKSGLSYLCEWQTQRVGISSSEKLTSSKIRASIGQVDGDKPPPPLPTSKSRTTEIDTCHCLNKCLSFWTKPITERTYF